MTISLGELGEQLVGKWLSEQDYQILHYRWRCRWGEIDVIARQKSQPMLVFVEVKTRSDRSWDNKGLDAIAPQKQRKISQTAALFLAKNPQLADFYCRFDVALVNCQKYQNRDRAMNKQFLKMENYPQGYSLMLEHYLENAFDFCD
ncbi:MAG: YraN family protein [Cyanobacteria bacterium P01_F01_bin.143]